MSSFAASNINMLRSADTLANETTQKLMQEFHPTTELREAFAGYEAPLSSALFINTFGFAPQYLFDRKLI
jgi:hypothetical protein